MPKSQLGDYFTLTTNDGQTLSLPNDDMTFIDWGGFGAPPVSWVTKQGYRQHGETEVGYYLNKRPITLKLHYHAACSKAQYYANRALIHDFLRHNRSGPMTLTLTVPQTQPVFTTSTARIATHLGQGQNPISTQLFVTSTAPFTAGNILLVDSEQELVQSVNVAGGFLNVQRAFNHTNPAGHLPGVLIYIQVTQLAFKQYSIIMRADPGMDLQKDQLREANWYLDEEIKFIAFNPIWFDPNVITQAVAAAASQNLVFPITFPIVFSIAGFLFSTIIPYTGTWYAYPTVTLSGPYQSAIVTNNSTGASFSLVVPLAAGQQRIVTTTPGLLAVTDQSGVNHFSDLGASSDLVDFNLRPAPEVPGGLNSIQVSMYSPNQAQGSAVTISYNNQYIGV